MKVKTSFSRSRARQACLMAAVASTAALLPAFASAQTPTPILDVSATGWNPNTDVLTPSIAPAGFSMTTDGDVPTLVPDATPNGSPALALDGNTGFDFNQLLPGQNVTVVAYIEPNTSTNQEGALVGGYVGGLEYRIHGAGDGAGVAGTQNVLAGQVADLGHSNTPLSSTAYSLVGVTVPAPGGSVNFYLNGNADGSTGAIGGLGGLSRVGASQLTGGGGDQEQYTGNIVELQVYNSVLTSAQLQAVQAEFTANYITPIAATNLSWTGAASSAWDTTATDNFAGPTGTPTTFANGDTVNFADFVSGTLAAVTNGNVVIQAGGVQPAAVTVSSSTVNYTFTDSDGVNGISGSTGLNMSGGSTLTLAGPNSFTGPINIQNGTVVVAASGALGASSGITLNGGDLYLQPGITIPSTIPLTLNSGSLTFNQSSSTSSLTYSSPITLASTSQIGAAIGNLTLSGQLSGPGGLLLNTAGLLTLSGSNTYVSDTTIDSGNVILSGSINSSGGNLHLAHEDNTVARLVISGGTANFAGGGGGSDIALGNTATAALEIDSGTLNVAQSIQIGPNVVAYGEFLVNGGATTIQGTLALGAPYGTGVATLTAGTVTTTGSSGVGLGEGTINYITTYTSTGILNLNGGSLITTNIQGTTTNAPGQAVAGGHVNFNGGTLKAYASSPQFIANVQSAYIYSGGAIIDDGGNSVTISSSLSNPDGSGITSIPVTSPGTGYSYQPIVEITGGTLTTNGAPATAVANYSNGQVVGITITSPGNYTSTSGLTATFVGGGGTAPTLGTFNTATNVGGGFTKMGSGTVTLSGNNTYSGPTKIANGTLQVSAPGTALNVLNPYFNANAPGGGGYTYYNGEPATDGYWDYYSAGSVPAGGAGITNGGGFAFNGAPPAGNQAAFIQADGAIQQTISFPATGNYTLSFYTEQRANGGNASQQVLDVDIDNPTAGGQDLTPGGFVPNGDWSLSTYVFPATAGSHTVTFQGLDPDNQDNTAFVNDVSLTENATGGPANAIPAASAVIISSGATLDVNGFTEEIGSLNGPAGSFVTLGTGGSLITGGDGTSTTFAGSISGAGSFAKLGLGTQTLSGANNYSGGTNVSGGALVFAAPAAFPMFTGLTVGAGAEAVAASHNSSSPKNTLFVTGLSIAGSAGAWTGKVDLGNNDMVVRGGSLSTITSQVAEGFNAGGPAWQGSGGIVSSAAANNSTHLTALGAIQNSVDGTPAGAALYPNFDGQPVTDADVLIKYTYYGDATLAGSVSATDYSRIDNGYLNHLTGWYNGDFNYDGVVNGSDYTLIDNAFNMQGAVLADAIASPTAQIAGGGTSAVPEPASLGLLGIGLVGLLGRRTRRRSH